jgi:hypothetical protein
MAKKNTKANKSATKSTASKSAAKAKSVTKKATGKVKKTFKKTPSKTKKTATKTGDKTKKATKKTTKNAKKTKKTKKTKKVKKLLSGGNSLKPVARYFKWMDGDNGPHGRYKGTKPKQAAAKINNAIWRSRETSGESTEGKIKFSIVECTRGSKHKVYKYVGERVKLDEPMEVTIGSGANAKKITYKFNSKVMKDKTTSA